MISTIDNILNRITMYRLVLYFLIGLVSYSFLLSLFGFLTFSPLAFLLTTGFLIGGSILANSIYSWAFDAPTNVESVYITSLILSLIVDPVKSFHDGLFIFWLVVISTATKYLLAYHKKHLFNPVAIAVFITSISIGRSASWWVGSSYLIPLVLFGGVLITRKVRRFTMVITFFLTAINVIVLLTLLKGGSVVLALENSFFGSSLFFMGFIMLTEPLTTPPTLTKQMLYAILTGILFAPQVRIFSLYTTPESALLIGNIFVFFVGSKDRFILRLKQKIKLAPDIYDFIFTSDRPLKFTPGQYLEWTLPHQNIDSRGNRRYFTLSSSPTESDVRIGIKFGNPPSSYKKALLEIDESVLVSATQLSGDFVMDKDPNKKYVFIAGGIGITPFRSMIKFLLDSNLKRDIILIYSAKSPDQLVYKDIFDDKKVSNLGIKIFYNVTDLTFGEKWNGLVGHLNSEEIKKIVPDYKDRHFYISGPQPMVVNFKRVLNTLASSSQIHTDYFPGFV